MSSAPSFTGHTRPKRPYFLPSSSIGLNPIPNANIKGKLIFVSEESLAGYEAGVLHSLLYRYSIDLDLVELMDYDPDDLPNESLVVFVISAPVTEYQDPDADNLVNWLREKTKDRSCASSKLLERCKFAVFGIDESKSGYDFGRDIVRWMTSLGASRMVPFGKASRFHKCFDSIFMPWSLNLLFQLKREALSMEQINASEELGEGDGAYLKVSDTDPSALKESREGVEESHASNDKFGMDYKFYPSTEVIVSEEEVQHLTKSRTAPNVLKEIRQGVEEIGASKDKFSMDLKEILSQMAPAYPEKQVINASEQLGEDNGAEESINFKASDRDPSVLKESLEGAMPFLEKSGASSDKFGME